MTTTGSRPVPALPAACRDWCRAQPPALLVADEWGEIDLDRWSSRLATQGVDLLLVAAGPDGGVVDSGTGYLRRSDLWAAGRRARGSIEEAVVALYMCAAWLSSHPLRSGVVRGCPDFRVHQPTGAGGFGLSELGFPLVLHHVVDWLEAPAEAMNLLKYGVPSGTSGHGVPDLGYPLASLYLSSVGMAWSQQDHVPVDPAGIASLVHAGWTEIDSLSRMTPRRYEAYLEVVVRWADEAGVDPLIVEMWLVQDWHDRRSGIAPTGSSAQSPPWTR